MALQVLPLLKISGKMFDFISYKRMPLFIHSSTVSSPNSSIHHSEITRFEHLKTAKTHVSKPPLDDILVFLLNQSDTFQDISDVVYPPLLLHFQAVSCLFIHRHFHKGFYSVVA